MVGENEIYENPPFDTRIQNGKVVGVKRHFINKQKEIYEAP